MFNAVPKSTNEASNIVSYIVEAFGRLSCETDLTPNNQGVNSLLCGLVRFATAAHNAEAAAQALLELEAAGLVETVRRICQQAECLLESHYSELLAYSDQ